MRLRYLRKVDGVYYIVYLCSKDESYVVAHIETGIWEMPRRKRWEIRLVLGEGKGKGPWHYEDTLAETKEWLEATLLRLVESGLEELVES